MRCGPSCSTASGASASHHPWTWPGPGPPSSMWSMWCTNGRPRPPAPPARRAGEGIPGREGPGEDEEGPGEEAGEEEGGAPTRRPERTSATTGQPSAEQICTMGQGMRGGGGRGTVSRQRQRGAPDDMAPIAVRPAPRFPGSWILDPAPPGARRQRPLGLAALPPPPGLAGPRPARHAGRPGPQRLPRQRQEVPLATRPAAGERGRHSRRRRACHPRP